MPKLKEFINQNEIPTAVGSREIDAANARPLNSGLKLRILFEGGATSNLCYSHRFSQIISSSSLSYVKVWVGKHDYNSIIVNT